MYEAFKRTMKASAWKEEPQRFEIDFLSELTKLDNELKERRYETLKGSEFIIQERGRTRHIYGARMRDRVVRHAICDGTLIPAIKPYLIHNNGASQKGKGLSFSRKEFEKDLHGYYLEHGDNHGYIGFMDISKFYDNVRHHTCMELFSEKIDLETEWLLKKILQSFRVDISDLPEEEREGFMDKKFNSVEFQESRKGEYYAEKSVNIGDQVSQTIGICYPIAIDNYAKIVRGAKRYGRYTDDIYIIEKDKERLKSIMDGIRETAKSLGLFINDKKTRIVKLSATYKYLQVKYSLTETGRVIKRINPATITRRRKKLKAYKRMMDAGTMQYEDIRESQRSWLGEFTKIMSKEQIKGMVKLYDDLFGETVRLKMEKGRYRKALKEMGIIKKGER